MRDRITHLERELTQFGRQQDQRRSRRDRHGLPVVSLVGYTNAGKSTLLNVLTSSQVSAQNRLFETLDTTSRRLRFPEDREVIITDTVGFIEIFRKNWSARFGPRSKSYERPISCCMLSMAVQQMATLGVVGGTAAAAGLGAKYFKYGPKLDDRLRVGIIGTGDEGNVLIGALNPDYVDVVAIADIRP